MPSPVRGRIERSDPPGLSSALHGGVEYRRAAACATGVAACRVAVVSDVAEKPCPHENIRLHADARRLANRVYPAHCKDCDLPLTTAMLAALILRDQDELELRVAALEQRIADR